ncbi:MAG: gamma-glutamyltransferase [Deferribacteres bacterium]|nr:gamma-glutamyltransferase [candidate division KSB1 bacterium]MCB9504153.1 gamma-glutamyltransferase [Deferribacteres bacterium]
MKIKHLKHLICWLLLPQTVVLVQAQEAISKIDTAASAMVVAAHPTASQVGVEILRQGGNAVDAAVATAFVVGVVEPHASGLGGGGGMLVYLKNNNEFHYLDYYMQTSENADTAYNRDQDLYSPRSVCIPGTVSGLITAVQKYGRLPLSTVMAPAIRTARQGFVVSEKFYTNILDKLEVISKFPETQKLFFKNDFPVAEGDTLNNLALATLLEKIAENGASYFYKGDFAQHAVKDIQAAGGYITLDDFASYQAIERDPASIDYHNFHLYSAPPPQSGVTLLELLNIFENADVPAQKRFIDDAETVNLFCESIKRADSDRFQFLGDPRHFNIPVSGLLNENYARTRFSGIEPQKRQYPDSMNIPAGDPWSFSQNSDSEIPQNMPEDGPHTTHISVVDSEGNAVSLTQTLGLFFGSGFSSQGVVFNSAMNIFYQYPSPNRIGPRRRPLTTISPTMITRNDSLSVVIGTPGGGQIFNVLGQIIVRLLDFGYSPQAAMDSPRFSARINSRYLSMENRFPVEVKDQLQNMGYHVRTYNDYDNFFGGVQMIVFDRATNQYIGVSDPRRDGGASGY